MHYERQLVTGRWMECRGSPIPGGGYLAVYRDIDERKRMESALQRMATRDELTGLPNRRSLMEKLESELERLRRYGHAPSVLLMDLDHFKSVNDRHGHAAGDTVLQFAAKVMDGVLREIDTVGRFGGEEFAVVLPATDGARAVQAADRIRVALSALEIDVGDATVSITISIGVATAMADEGSKELLARADAALYKAKQDGRNRVVVHEA